MKKNTKVNVSKASPSFSRTDLKIGNTPGELPIASYIPIVGVHTTLLAFTALFLPRTTFLHDLTRPEWDPSQLTSRDRPQHPFLEALTISPVSTLACICVGAAVLQGWWAGWLRDWWLRSVVEGNLAERKLEKASIEKQRLLELGKACAATLAMSFIFHFILVLFGAPFVNLKLRTYLLGLLISILVVFPPAYVLGPPTMSADTSSLVRRLTWIRLFAEFSTRNSLDRAMVYPVIGTTVGCWIGVVPIALDWDRPWQAWPLMPAFGAITGYILASIYALTVNSATSFNNEQRRLREQTDKKTS